MTSLISFILIISFLIFIHELGHLLAAKWANVKVDDFSIGFGPKIFSFNIGETKYSLSLLPLGGYVKMQGEDISDLKNKADGIEIDPKRSFKNLSNLKKQIILFAGPGMNLILPFLLLPFIYLNGVEIPSFLKETPEVGYVSTDIGSKYFKKGDLILEINSTKINTWEDIKKEKKINLNKSQNILIKRNGSYKSIVFDNDKNKKFYILNSVYPKQSAIIDQVLPKSLADEISLNKGDKILRINNVRIQNWYQISEVLNNQSVTKFNITFERNKNLFTKEFSFKENKRMLGITPEVTSTFYSFTLYEAIKNGYHDSIRMIGLIFNGIIGLFSGLFSSDSSMAELKSSLAGPISIAKYSGLAAEKGFNSLIQFIVVISINLGIINLLPIPLLDGGHIFFNTIEVITRRKINPNIQNFINKIGFAILITLMLFAIYNDIVNF